MLEEYIMNTKERTQKALNIEIPARKERLLSRYNTIWQITMVGSFNSNEQLLEHFQLFVRVCSSYKIDIVSMIGYEGI